ncbi:MAG: DUF192 domain-containing protein [Bacillota bacterium]|nr:DUF192 domain-containing protein [Bacillota bacterium]MDW7683951.1 DUF192 domain-containing protein [Bacillota bacterium]
MLIKPDGTVVAKRLKRADTFGARLKGLMFQNKFPPDYDALVITPCSSVHTMFMQFCIDVLFLDQSHEVLHILHNMVPGRVSPVIKGSSYAVEVLGGHAERCGIQIGDRLCFQNEQGKAVSSC